MEKLIIVAAVIVCLLAAFVLAHTVVTDKIIKDQEREIAQLKTENKRLKSALRGVKSVSKIVLSDKPLDYPPTAKIKLSARDSLKEY